MHKFVSTIAVIPASVPQKEQKSQMPWGHRRWEQSLLWKDLGL